MNFVSLFRKLPHFKGKLRLAALFFSKDYNSKTPSEFYGKYGIKYLIPNCVDFVGKELFFNGIYEPKTISLILSLLNKSSVFFDVGANIGSISIPVSKLSNCMVYAFESSHFNSGFLKQNVLSNSLQKFTVEEVAVHSVHNTKLRFYETEGKFGGSSLSPTYNKTFYEVNSLALDNYCNQNGINYIDVLKIDIQGFEIEALKGAINLIMNKSIRAIIFEMESWAEKEAGYEPGEAQRFLIENGYELFSLEKIKSEEIITNGSAMFLAKPSKNK